MPDMNRRDFVKTIIVGDVNSLIDVEALDGTHHRILMDTGWNVAYMDGCFKRTVFGSVPG